MFAFWKHSLAVAGLALSAVVAQASPVIGTVSKTYGSGADHATAGNTGRGSCDTLNSSSITVRDTAFGCTRFVDELDFSGLDYDSIDGFSLTLTFSRTADVFLWVFPEDWRLRPMGGDTVSRTLFDITRSDGTISQTFDFSAANLDVFASIVDAGSFKFLFADEALGANSFNLMSAALTVRGSAAVAEVPEPGSLALVGLAAVAAGLVRRRRQR